MIQWCVLGLFVLFITLPIWKEKKSSYVFYAGIILRVVLLGSMTLEMIHQVLARQYTIETFEVLTDFMQFLIYGYVLLASLFYVISLPYLKNRGMFFAFDLSVLLLPLCQTVFIVLVESKKFFLSGDTELVWRNLMTIVLMIGFAALVLYLFFRLFWHQKWKELLFFYGLIFAALLYIFYPSISKHELQSSFKSIVILVAAAGSFMTLHSLCALLQNKVKLRQWGAWGIVVFFMMLLNPILNLPHIMFQFTKTELTDTFSEEYRPLSEASAKAFASKFVPADISLYSTTIKQPISDNYVFAADQYEVNVSAFTGELNSYFYHGRAKGQHLTDKEYRENTIEFFERSGRSVDLDRIRVVIEKEDGETSVLLLPKMSQNKDESLAFATWKKETLRQAQYGNAIFQLKDSYREVLILRDIQELSYEEVAEILNWTLSKVKTTLHRARLELKRKLHCEEFNK
ncbi:sigma factor-like helix-turn-helix DNA-binding protein [Bacillus altitudinis]|uniref:sigma factor-like helix-turn-helix DNA-binding protein n=1 Tax=Bacillus altitudinis TaxID=293387 RepID=UPI0025598ACC